jgi:hypothetical protein
MQHATSLPCGWDWIAFIMQNQHATALAGRGIELQHATASSKDPARPAATVSTTRA